MSEPVRKVEFFRPPLKPNGGTVYRAPRGEQEEDEVLLEWLKANYPTLSTEKKRASVRRLCGEFGYTARGVASVIGVSQSTVANLRLTDEQLEAARAAVIARGRRAPRVVVSRVVAIADQWQERAAEGLSPAEALELLCQLRALGKSSAAQSKD